MAKVIEVIETEVKRGTGKDESSPVRTVAQYWTLGGDLLAERDPFKGDSKVGSGGSGALSFRSGEARVFGQGVGFREVASGGVGGCDSASLHRGHYGCPPDCYLYENERGERLLFTAVCAPVDAVDYSVSGPWHKVTAA